MSDPKPAAADVTLDEMREWAATLKHDLGRYVAFRSANLAESSWHGELDELAVTSLRADVLATRDHASGPEPAWAVFDRVTQPWPRPWPAELEAVALAVLVLRRHGAALAADDRPAIAAARNDIRLAQGTIRTELAALHRRLVREA